MLRETIEMEIDPIKKPSPPTSKPPPLIRLSPPSCDGLPHIIQANPIKVGDIVTWKSTDKINSQTIVLEKGGFTTTLINPPEPVNFVGIVDRIRSDMATIYWVGYSIEGVCPTVVARSSINNTDQRHRFFGTNQTDPTFEDFVKIGLKSVNMSLEGLEKVGTEGNQWWVPVVKECGRYKGIDWVCNVM